MQWNWQQREWPRFAWDQEKLVRAERIFLEETGASSGASIYLTPQDKENLTVDLMTGTAVDTAKIEGETLNRDSVQSSIRRSLGLAADRKKSRPAEAGIAAMTVDNFTNYSAPLRNTTLCAWHGMIMAGRTDMETIGKYRTHPEPMQIVSGTGRKKRVHFEAPPSDTVAKEMKKYIAWFNRTIPANGKSALPVLVKAGIAHIWFESIHPFEDGNGRIGRALAEKAIMQHLTNPLATTLSTTLEKRRKEYYQALEKASTTLEITDWLLWFSAAAIEATRHCFSIIRFLIAKTKMLDALKNRINPRQEKALLRLFSAGPDGFVGGLSAGNYSALTGAAPATATRDLADLVNKNALRKTGEKKASRYWLSLPFKPVAAVSIADIQ